MKSSEIIVKINTITIDTEITAEREVIIEIGLIQGIGKTRTTGSEMKAEIDTTTEIV